MRIAGAFLGLAALAATTPMAWATDAIVDDQPRLMGSGDVDTCDAYGTGFARMPGTHTCARVSGQMRFEEGVSTGGRSTHGRTTLDFETRSD